MVKLAEFMGYYYDTRKAVMFINKIPFNIMVVKHNVYFQHNGSPLVSLDKKIALMKEIQKLNPTNYIDGLVNISAHYSQILENKK